MKRSTLKAIVFFILPAIILLGIGIYFLFQIPQVKYGWQKALFIHMIEKKLRQGELSQEHGIQLKRAFNRFFTVIIKLEKREINEQIIDNEIGKLAIEKQMGPNFGIPDDDEVEKLIDFFNELSERLEELLKNSIETSK